MEKDRISISVLTIAVRGLRGQKPHVDPREQMRSNHLKPPPDQLAQAEERGKDTDSWNMRISREAGREGPIDITSGGEPRSSQSLPRGGRATSENPSG